MSKIVEVYNQDFIPFLADFLHDSYVEFDKIKFKIEENLLEIPFEKLLYQYKNELKNYIFFGKYSYPLYSYNLKIFHVEDYNIIEFSNCGMGDSDIIANTYYNDIEKILEIEFQLSKKLKIQVRDLKIVLEKCSFIKNIERWSFALFLIDH